MSYRYEPEASTTLNSQADTLAGAPFAFAIRPALSPQIAMSHQQLAWSGSDSPTLRNPMLAGFKSNSANAKLGTRRKSKYEGILDEINDFQTSLRNDLVPEYDKLEMKLSDQITDVVDRVDQLNDIRRERRELAELFFGKVGDTRSEINEQVAKIREWHQNDRDIQELQDRINKARHNLDIHKERLARLAKETEEFELVNVAHGKRVRKFTRLAILCVLVVLIAVLTHYNYLSIPSRLKGLLH